MVTREYLLVNFLVAICARANKFDDIYYLFVGAGSMALPESDTTERLTMSWVTCFVFTGLEL